MSSVSKSDLSSQQSGKVTYWFVCLSMLLASCGGDELDPKSLLQSYRVVAIRAEPPTMDFTSETRIELYDFHPNDLKMGRPTIKYTWSLCPFSLGSITQYECLLDEIDLSDAVQSSMAAPSDEDPASPSPRPTPQAILALSPPLIFAQLGDDINDQLEQLAMGSDMMLGDEMNFFDSGILEVYLKLRVEIEGEEDFTAVKTLSVVLDPAIEANTNPVLEQLITDPLIMASSPFNSEDEVKLSAEYQEGSAEEYTPPQSEDAQAKGQLPDPITEKLLFSWYTTSGSFDKPIRLAEDTSTTLTLGEEPGEHRLYLTLRDGRGGVDLRMISFTLSE